MKSVLIKIFFVIVLAAALWAVLQWRAKKDIQIDSVPTDQQSPDASNEILYVSHTYLDGKHTLTGKIALPTPCHDLTTEAVVMESFPERVNVNFRIEDSGEICAQVIDERDFRVDFQASPKPVIAAFIDGKAVSLVIDDKSGSLKP